MPLEEYRRKRDFARTPEPDAASLAPTTGRVRRPAASGDPPPLRLPPRDRRRPRLLGRAARPEPRPAQRRMAVHVEDHPIEYLDFEGVIPNRQYGGGDVIVWDWGTWEPEMPDSDPAADIAAGELKFGLGGEKLRGRFTIVRTRPRRAASRGETVAAHPQARRRRGRRLGRRGPPAERQDRPHERRGQGEPRRDLGQSSAPAAAGRDRPIAGHARQPCRPSSSRCWRRSRRDRSTTPTGCSRSSGTATGSRRSSATARSGR